MYIRESTATTASTTTTSTTATATINITFTDLMKSALMLQFTRAYISEPKILFRSKFQLESLVLLEIFGT